MGDPAAHGGGARPGDGALLHDHEAPGRAEGGVRPPHALQSEPAGQHDRVARGTRRPVPLRPPARLRLPEAEARLRPAAGRRAHRPGPDHLAAAVLVEPARLERDPGLAPGVPHRPVADLRPAALPRRLRAGGAARAPARDRRLRQPDRDGADAPAVTGAHLRRPARRRRGRGARGRAGRARARPAGVGDLDPRAGGPQARRLGDLRRRAEAPRRDPPRPHARSAPPADPGGRRSHRAQTTCARGGGARRRSP